jgi:branched-chain amino acid transport system ATP-binding protein
MTAPLLKLEHLEVRYGDLIGVSDVSLEVPERSVVALLGSNGGGKTTTLNAIAGLIPVHSGSIIFRGEAIAGQTAFAIVRKGLALSPEGWRLFVQQSVENNLLLGATPLRDRARIAVLLDRVYEIFPKLAERRNQRAGTIPRTSTRGFGFCDSAAGGKKRALRHGCGACQRSAGAEGLSGDGMRAPASHKGCDY